MRCILLVIIYFIKLFKKKFKNIDKMSQAKNVRAKAQITFCNADLFKFSKQKLYSFKKTKQRSIDCNNQNSYPLSDEKVNSSSDNEKDKIIHQLHLRISELESRIKKLESQQHNTISQTDKPKRHFQIVMTEPNQKRQYLSASNSSKKILTNNKKTELSLIAKSHIGLMQNLKAISRTRFRNLSLSNLKAKKSVPSNEEVNTMKRNNSVGQYNDYLQTIKNTYKRDTYLKTDNTWDISSTSSVTNTTSNNTYSITNSNKPHNIKTIPKIPKRNDNAIFITCNNSMSSVKSNNSPLKDISYYKAQFDLIKNRTQNVIQKIIESKL